MLPEKDINDLRNAVRLLENPGVAAKIMNVLGMPIEAGLHSLPPGVQESITSATKAALSKALDAALLTLSDEKGRQASNWLHTGLAATSGLVGGFFGLPALAIELPISTVIMLRSVADIARSEGEDISSPEAALSCLEVFALGSPNTKNDDEVDEGYYTFRLAMAGLVSQATSYIAATGKAGVEVGAPPLIKLITTISARYGLAVSEKVVVQSIPIIGAASGALINTLFIDHFQDMARGHFTVRRLERLHGELVIRSMYQKIRIEQNAEKIASSKNQAAHQ
jgi:hypothetical protein